jgi:hypothetical protein
MKHILFLALALSLSACTTEDGGERPSSANASRTFSAANSRIEQALAKLGNLAPNVAVSITEPCAISGNLGIDGTHDLATDAFEITATFTACVESGAEGTLDGSLQWKSQTVGDTTTQTWDGTLLGDDGTVSWSCLFDLTIVEDSNGATQSGTICGYDASTI